MKIKSVDEIFKIAGGAIHVAAFLGLNQYTVERWAKTGIPAEHYTILATKYGLEVSDIHAASEKARLIKKKAA